jgi:hypothetical protein
MLPTKQVCILLRTVRVTASKPVRDPKELRGSLQTRLQATETYYKTKCTFEELGPTCFLRSIHISLPEVIDVPVSPSVVDGYVQSARVII